MSFFRKFFNILILLSFSFAFISCSEEEEKEDCIITANPSSSSDEIIISAPYMEGLTYINIFRKIADSDKSYNIGQIITLADKNKNMTYNFSDNLLVADIDFRYRARFLVNGIYQYSEWSDLVSTTKSDFTDLPKVSVSGTDVYFEFDNEKGILTLKGATDASGNDPELGYPTEGSFYDFTICLAINNGNITRIFTVTEEGKVLANDSTISLYSILNEAFYNKELSLKGVVLQKITETYEKNKDTTSALRYTTVQWSLPVDTIPVKASKDKEKLETFVVKLSDSSENIYDYSPLNSARVYFEPSLNEYELDYSDL